MARYSDRDGEYENSTHTIKIGLEDDIKLHIVRLSYCVSMGTRQAQ